MRKWKIIAALLALIALAALAYTRLLVVRRVEVTGAGGMEDTVIRASGIEFGTSIFSVDESAVRDGVNALGIVALEKVELHFPDRIAISIRERSREAMLLWEEKIVILDGEAVVVEVLDEVPDRDLLYISGMEVFGAEPGRSVEAAAERLEACRALLGAVNGCGAGAYLSELNLEDAENLRLITRMGTAVELGSPENLEEKIAWIKAVVQDLERRGETAGVLDVSGAGRADYRPAGFFVGEDGI